MSTYPNRFAVHLTVAALACAASTVFVHYAAHWIAVHWTHVQVSPQPDPATLRTLIVYLQAATIAVFTVILGSFVHSYPVPFFIFWFLGWLSWLLLYLLRLLHQEWAEVFNAANSYFFVAAGVDLLAPRRVDRFLRQYPLPPTKTVGSPLRWYAQYVIRNPATLLLLAPVGLVLFTQTRSVSLNTFAEGTFAVLSITLLGLGLYRRFADVSPNTAFATLILSGLYLQVPIAKLLWPVGLAGHQFDYALAVLAPALVLKPALALFMTMLAFRETSYQSDQHRFVMVRNLPDACLLVRDGLVTAFNERAEELFGLAENEKRPLNQLFASQQSHDAFVTGVREQRQVYGFDAQLWIGPLASRYRTSRWARLDAFYATDARAMSRVDDMVLLVLDRHERELAWTVAAYVHDIMLPKIIRLKGCLEQRVKVHQATQGDLPSAPFLGEELRATTQLVRDTDVLKEEFREYWRVQAGKEKGADLHTAFDLAWAQALHSCADLSCEPELNLELPLAAPVNIPSLSESSLTRVLQNVLSNAIKATFRREQRRMLTPIDVAIEHSDDWVLLRIRDHGDGFPDRIMHFMNGAADTVGVSDIGNGLFQVKLSVARAGGGVRVGNVDQRGGGWLQIVLPASSEVLSSVD